MRSAIPHHLLANPLSPRLNFLANPPIPNNKNEASYLSHQKTPLFRQNSNLFSVMPSLYLSPKDLPEKITSFSEYSQTALNTLKREVCDNVFKFKKHEETVVMLNNIQITIHTLNDFEFKGQVSENLMNFFLNYLMKLQVLENKSVFFLKLMSEEAENIQIPKKNFYKYLIFPIKSKNSGSWMMILFDTDSGNCDIIYPFEECAKMELISLARKILKSYNLQSRSLLINTDFKTEPHNDSGLMILSLLLEIYLTNKSLEKIESQPLKKNEFLWAIYELISSQHQLIRKKSVARASQFIQLNNIKAESPRLPIEKKRKKPDLKLIIPKVVEKMKENIGKTPKIPPIKEKSPEGREDMYYLKSAFQKQNSFETAKTARSPRKSAIKLPNISQNSSLNERIMISKTELKGLMKDMKDSIFQEIEKKNLIRNFISKEVKSDENTLKYSRKELKKMLNCFREEFHGNIENEKKKKQEEFARNQMKMEQFQNMLSYFYYSNPEMYEQLSREFSKRVGEYYLGGLFNNKI